MTKTHAPAGTRVLRIDSAELAPLVDQPNGFAFGEARLTRTGVFEYRLSDGTIRRELRHPDEVFSAESIASLRMVPICDGHPSEDVTTENVRDLQIGTVGDSIVVDGQRFLRANVCLTDKKAIAGIKGGRDQVSCGYWADVVDDEGEYDGERYDSRQTNIRYNHLAANIEAGRAGPEVKIRADRRDAVLVGPAKATSTKPTHDRRDDDGKEKPMTRKIRVNKMTLDAEENMAQAVEAEIAEHKAKIAELEAKLAEMNGAVDAAGAKAVEAEKAMDAAKAKADEYKAQVEKLTAAKADTKAIAEAAKARVALLRIADAVLEDKSKIDDMDDDAIRRAVIMQANPKAKLDGASPEYLRARFDTIVESLDENPIEHADTRNDRNDDEGEDDLHADSVETPRDAYHSRILNSWKGEEKADA